MQDIFGGDDMGYSDVYAEAKADPDGFWSKAAEAIDWVTPPTRRSLTTTPPFMNGFPMAR